MTQKERTELAEARDLALAFIASDEDHLTEAIIDLEVALAAFTRATHEAMEDRLEASIYGGAVDRSKVENITPRRLY